MVEGKNEEMSTSELSGGARIHYIFQSIFVSSLEVYSVFTYNITIIDVYYSDTMLKLEMKKTRLICLIKIQTPLYCISGMDAQPATQLLVTIYIFKP